MSNLVIKHMFARVNEEDKRVIDTNALMKKRMDELAEKMKLPGNSGFTAGLDAEEVECLLADEGGESGISGNVIKANEDAAHILEQAKGEASTIVSQARADAMKILEGARADAEAERERILDEARQQGYSEGQKKAEAEVQAVRQEYAGKERKLESVYEEQLRNMEPQLVDTITGIYEHIFHVELYSYREILAHLISTTLRKLEGGHEFVIHVSREDYPYVNMQKKQILAGVVTGNSNVDIVEDLTLSKNDCMIETESGIFDCGLGTQLAELTQKLRLLSWSKED